MKPLYFLYHLPKTGGQSIRDHLDTHLRRDRDFLHLGKWDRATPLTFDHVAEMSPIDRSRLRSLGGHPLDRGFRPLFPDRVIREVFFVREPAARLVSLYNFQATRAGRSGDPVPTLEEFLAGRSPNLMTHFAARLLLVPRGPTILSGVLAELAKLWMVGTTDSMDRLTPFIFEALGIGEHALSRTNVTGVEIDRHAVLTPQLADDLRAENPLDVMLFEACRRLERRTMERFGVSEETGPLRPIGFVPT